MDDKFSRLRSFNDLGRQASKPLFVEDDKGSYRKATGDEILTAGKAVMNRRCRQGSVLTSPEKTREFLRAQFAGLEREVFAVIWLDSRHQIIAFDELFRGTLDGASVYPREVVRSALAHNAAAGILAHNHPSGVADPSRTDEAITRRLKDALALMDIRVIDHIVLGDGPAVSFAERGLL